MGENVTSLPMKVGGSVQPIVPQSLEDAWRVAAAFAKSGMAPKGMDTAEACLVAIMAGAEVGLAPFQSVQSIAVINGRATMWGDALPAIVRRYGVKITETIDGEGDAMVATCSAARPDGEVITRTFSVEDAKKANLWQTQPKVKRKNYKTNEFYEADNDSPWYKYPKRMLQMRARGWALRDGCADMLRGIAMREEVEDFGTLASEPVNEHDQRPADEIESEGAFIMGEAWSLVEAHYTAIFANVPTIDEAEKQWESFQRKYWKGKRKVISQNSFDGMHHLFDNALVRLETGDMAMTSIRGFITGCEDLDELEAWRADASTEVRWEKLSDAQQVEAQTLYEARQEEFAEALHKTLADERNRG